MGRAEYVRAGAAALVAAGMVAPALAPTPGWAQSASDLAQLSIEQLGDVQVTSLSKRPESVLQASGSIYVITRDELLASGAKTVPEMLRLAPNLEVAQTSASRYAITARGLNGADFAQNFSNKLLVLIDGRTVYTPLYSGVYWDMQGVLPEDVERIEVISGPGATLWGANAVNGVINIITRSANDTQGLYADAGLGAQEHHLAARYGGRLGETASYRAYVQSFRLDDTVSQAGVRNHDHWARPQAGARIDWTPSGEDALTLQGDLYHGQEAQNGAPSELTNGGNLTGRWTRTWSPRSMLQLQAFYDHAQRSAEVDGSGFYVDTFDADLQSTFALGDHQELVWGSGYRTYHYRIYGTPTLFWEPPAHTLAVANGFVQDTVSLTRTLSLVAGLKVEDDPYLDPVLLPNVRLGFAAGPGLELWGSVSQAIRAPTPFDREVVEVVGGQRFLLGSHAFESEKVTAYEAGFKAFDSARASLSVTGYYNVYDDLRTIEPTPVSFTPLFWGNGIKGKSWGVEAWGDLQLMPWWRVSGSLGYLHERFRFAPRASGIVGLNQTANDPDWQAQLKSTLALDRFSASGALRYVAAQPNPVVPAYVELNGRVAYRLTDQVELAVVGRNLLHDRHLEYAGGAEIPRSVFADLQWRF